MTREEALKMIGYVKTSYNTCNFTRGSFTANEWFTIVEQALKEPKTGHWCRKTIVDAYDIAGVKTWGIKYQCDRCGFTTIVIEDFGYYNYCPNCGSKMEGMDKDE